MSDNLSIFKEIYGNDIEVYTKQINRQFAKITNANFKSIKTNIKLLDSGTSISYNVKRDGNGAEQHHYTLNIGFNDIETMQSTHQSLDTFDSFCKIVTHEYMHVLMGNFDKKFLNALSAFTVGKNLFFRREENFLESPFFVYSRSSSMEDVKNHEIDKSILNIAADFEINQLLNIDQPFLRAYHFGLPEGLSTFEYYSILWHVFRNQSKNYLNEYYSKLKSSMPDPKEFNSACNHIDIDKSSAGEFSHERDYQWVSERNKCKCDSLQSNIAGMIKKLNIAESGIWKDFKDAMNCIKKRERDQRLSFIDKSDDWCKFNNRKDGSLMYPGKYEIRGAMERKMNAHSVAFVDISASMMNVVEPLYTFCHLLCNRLNITLVFYDTEIKHIYHSDSKVALEPSLAYGTNFGKAYSEYLEKFGKPMNLYVITDGFDYSLSDFYGVAKIWKLYNGGLKSILEGGS